VALHAFLARVFDGTASGGNILPGTMYASEGASLEDKKFYSLRAIDIYMIP